MEVPKHRCNEWRSNRDHSKDANHYLVLGIKVVKTSDVVKLNTLILSASKIIRIQDIYHTIYLN